MRDIDSDRRRAADRRPRTRSRVRPDLEACESRALLSTLGVPGTYTYTGSPQGEIVSVQANNISRPVYAGDLELSLNGAPVTTIAYCVDLPDTIWPKDATHSGMYNIVTSTTSALHNGGEIAYLINTYAPQVDAQLQSNPGQSAADLSAGLQLAIWDLEYPGFQVATDPGTHAQYPTLTYTAGPGDFSATPGAVADEANFLALGVGHTDTASYLQPDPNAPGGQGMVVVGQALTQGFWKNHPAAWPVSSLTIAGQNFTESQLITLLQTPPKKGDAALILAHQLIAAELNVLNGALPSMEVVNAIELANSLLTPDGNGGFKYVSSGTPLGQEMTDLANILDAFNSQS